MSSPTLSGVMKNEQPSVSRHDVTSDALISLTDIKHCLDGVNRVSIKPLGKISFNSLFCQLRKVYCKFDDLVGLKTPRLMAVVVPLVSVMPLSLVQATGAGHRRSRSHWRGHCRVRSHGARARPSLGPVTQYCHTLAWPVDSS